MIKSLLLTAVAIFLSLPVNAQYAWGVQTELGITSFKQQDQFGNPTAITNPLMGGAVGGFYHNYLSSKFILKTGLSYLHFRAQALSTSSEWTIWEDYEVVIEGKRIEDYTVSYLTVPVTLSYIQNRWDFGLGFQIGVKVADQLKSDTEFKISHGFEKTPEYFEGKNQLNSTVDFGPRLALTYQINSKFDLGFNFYKGLITAKNDGLEKKTLSAFFALNYRIHSNATFVDYHALRQFKKNQRKIDKANAVKKKSPKKVKTHKKRLKRAILSFHADIGICPSTEFKIFNRDKESYESLLLSKAFGFKLSNNRGQFLFLETGLIFDQIGIEKTTSMEGLYISPKSVKKTYMNFVRVPLSVGINKGPFVFQIGGSVAKSTHNKVVKNSNIANRSSQITKPLNNFQFGPRLSAGFRLSNSFTINTTFQANMQKIDKNMNFTIGLTYAFN